MILAWTTGGLYGAEMYGQWFWPSMVDAAEINDLVEGLSMFVAKRGHYLEEGETEFRKDLAFVV